jgi:hypothetical protein
MPSYAQFTKAVNTVSLLLQRCGMFSSGFNSDVQQVVDILVNLPPMDEIR